MESSELESNTPNINIKTIEIQEGHNQYKCQIQIIKHFLQITLYLQEKLKYEGNIPLYVHLLIVILVKYLKK